VTDAPARLAEVVLLLLAAWPLAAMLRRTLR
jgi:hypothetical protein